MSSSYCSYFYTPWTQYNNLNVFVNFYQIRLSMFLLTGVCAGSLALVWALHGLCLHYKSRGRISLITISLLFSDLLELILNPFLVSYMFDGPCIFKALICARLCGVQFHQLLALETVLTLKYPSVAHFFSPICSIILCSLVWLFGIGCQFTPGAYKYLLFVCSLSVTSCAVTCIVTCKASPDTSQSTDRKPEVLVLSVAMFSLIFFYVPFFVHIVFDMSFMLDCLTSMRLISEPILCDLFCRETHMVNTAHQQTDHAQ